MFKKTITTTTITETPKQSLAESFKPKRAGKNTSHVIFVLDDSGSMQTVRDTTISGYNEYLDAQRRDAVENEIPTYVSLYKFDGTNVSCVFDHIDSSEAPALTKETYDPRGMTNLYDAIGETISKINRRLTESAKEHRDSVIVAILTDGQENASRKYDNRNVKQIIEKCEGKGWGFMFLGANIDAFALGQSLGFRQSNTIQYDTANMNATMAVASNMTSRMKSGYARGMDTESAYTASAFTDVERSSTVGKDD